MSNSKDSSPKNKINSNDLIRVMRNSSNNSEPSKNFENKLLSKLLKKKDVGFFSKISTKKFSLIFSVLLLVFVGGYFYFLKPNINPQQPSNDDDRATTNATSPLLEELKLNPDNDPLKRKNGFLEKGGKTRVEILKNFIQNLINRHLYSKIYLEDKKATREGRSDVAGSPSYTTEESSLPEATTYNVSQGSLKGGEIDDNELFAKFLEYMESAQKGSAFDIDLSTRYQIIIKDSNGKRILGQEIDIKDSLGREYKLTTDSDGEIYFFPNAYRLEDLREQQKQRQDNNQQDPSQDNSDSPRPDNYTLKIDNQEYTFSSEETKWVINDVTDVSSIEDLLKLDLVFTLDSTGSMSDQINKIRDTIADVTSKVKDRAENIEIRYGLVIYRDKGDEYLTRIYDFTSNLEDFQNNLSQVEAGGGGDYPEDVNTALKDSIEHLSWSSESNTIKINFLVADAPPHNDYNQDYDYRIAMLRAAEQGIKIFPLASSGLDNTEGEYVFRQLSLITNAKYIFITKQSGATDYHVSEQDYTVANLDELVVEVILEEIEAAELAAK
jgi:hypothetical protein